MLAVIATAAGTTWWALAGLAMVIFLIPATQHVLGGGQGLTLVRTLKLTGFAELAGGLGIFAGMLIGA